MYIYYVYIVIFAFAQVVCRPFEIFNGEDLMVIIR